MSCCRVGILNALEILTIESRRTRQTCGPNCHSLGQVLRLTRFKKNSNTFGGTLSKPTGSTPPQRKITNIHVLYRQLTLGCSNERILFSRQENMFSSYPFRHKPLCGHGSGRNDFLPHMCWIHGLKQFTLAATNGITTRRRSQQNALNSLSFHKTSPHAAGAKAVTRLKDSHVETMQVYLWRHWYRGHHMTNPNNGTMKGKSLKNTQYGILMTCVGIQNKHVSPQLWPLIPWLCCLIL